MKRSGIYKIQNLLDGKVYIGSSSNILKRWRNHRAFLRKNEHPNLHLQAAWNKYGDKIFKFEIIELVIEEKLIKREQYWLDFYQSYENNNGYNICQIAGRTDGLIPWNKGKSYPQMIGNIYRKGKEAWNKGLILGKESDITRKKKSLSHLGKKRAPFTEEHRRKMSLARAKWHAERKRI